MKNGLTAILLLGFFVVLLYGCDNNRLQECQLYTCKACHSVCVTNGKPPSFWNWPKSYRYKGDNFAHCSHKWTQGFSRAYPEPLPDGTIVLVKQGTTYGAFKLYNQKTRPESASFKWWIRTDGKGSLGDNNAVKNGDEITRNRGRLTYYLEFGSFAIMWSGNTIGKGYIYYQYNPGDKIPADGLKICVTGEKEVGNIDAMDKKWEYKSTTAF